MGLDTQSTVPSRPIIINLNILEDRLAHLISCHDWFKRNELFLNCIPADVTISRIISTIDPEQFHECFINWMSSIHTLTEGQGDCD